ncbi:MAG: aminotransferase class IV [Hyphomicrobiales bacterium]|nr:aminotransferase class IV [Hyphomicrobiales bacterium]
MQAELYKTRLFLYFFHRQACDFSTYFLCFLYGGTVHYTSINSRLISSEATQIAISERGFRYGDGVFETILLRSGLPYLWDGHMARLQAGLTALRLPPVDTVRLWQDSAALIAKNQIEDGILRLCISRGQGGQGYLPAGKSTPLIVIECLPGSEETGGITLWLSQICLAPASCRPTQAKTMQGLPYTLARLEASEAGADDALMCALDGTVAEAASGNVFWVQDGRLYAPVLATGCLPGTTRAAIMRFSPLPIQEVSLEPEALEQADEVFMTNAGRGIVPVLGLQPLGYRWEVGPVTQKLQAEREEDIRNDVARFRSSLV